MATLNANPFTFDRRTFGITHTSTRPRIQRQRSQQSAATPPSYVGLPRNQSRPSTTSVRRERERERERDRERNGATAARDLVVPFVPLGGRPPSEAPPRYSQIGSVRSDEQQLALAMNLPPVPPVPSQHRQRATPPQSQANAPVTASAVPLRPRRPRLDSTPAVPEEPSAAAAPSRTLADAQVVPPSHQLAAVQLQVPSSAPAIAPSGPRTLLSRPVRTIITDARFDHWRDGDIALRSRDGTLVPCHGANLASASPVLSALVSPPGVIGDCPVTTGDEPGGIPADLPIFDLNEDAEVLLLMLEYVYPRPAPSLSTLRFATVKALFSASRRYEVWRAIDASVAQLKALAPTQPFVVYSIAMHAREDCMSPTGGQVGLAACEALAKEASFHTLKHDLSKFNKSYFASLSGGAAHSLWALHTNRLAQGKNIILSMQFLSDPTHAPNCPEHRLMERYWTDEARRVAEELRPELDMQRRVVIREPNGAGCLHCYRALLRTASTVRARWEKVPDVVAI